MFHVRFSEKAVAALTDYVDAYRRGYCELFSDTGIWSEQAIIEQYERASQSLFDSLFSSIKQLLSATTVLGRNISNQRSECHFYLDDRLIIISYKEDTKNKKRTVELININRKAIFF